MKKLLKRLLRPLVRGMIKDEINLLYAEEYKDIQIQLSNIENCVKALREELTYNFTQRSREHVSYTDTN
jgi:hypothetical protein